MNTNSLPAVLSITGGFGEDLKVSGLWSMISEKGPIFTCTVFGKTKDNNIDKIARRQIEGHVESMHLEEVAYDCGRCDKTSRSRNALYKHTCSKYK